MFLEEKWIASGYCYLYNFFSMLKVNSISIDFTINKESNSDTEFGSLTKLSKLIITHGTNKLPNPTRHTSVWKRLYYRYNKLNFTYSYHFYFSYHKDCQNFTSTRFKICSQNKFSLLYLFLQWHFYTSFTKVA